MVSSSDPSLYSSSRIYMKIWDCPTCKILTTNRAHPQFQYESVLDILLSVHAPKGPAILRETQCSVGESTRCMGARIVLRRHRKQKYNDAFKECHERESPFSCTSCRVDYLEYLSDIFRCCLLACQLATPHVSSHHIHQKRRKTYIQTYIPALPYMRVFFADGSLLPLL